MGTNTKMKFVLLILTSWVPGIRPNSDYEEVPCCSYEFQKQKGRISIDFSGAKEIYLWAKSGLIICQGVPFFVEVYFVIFWTVQ